MNKQFSKSKTKKLKQLIEMLKFTLTVDDKEIVHSSIESVIEELEDLAK